MPRIAATETGTEHTIDDIEDREISTARVRGFYPKWAYED
jgi:hypothetical protein